MHFTVLSFLVTAGLVLFLSGGEALAVRGDCGQPVSGGNRPSTTDALVVLRAAVGSGACGVCACDPSGDGRVSTTDALAVLRGAVGAVANLSCGLCDGAGVTGRLMAPGGNIEPVAGRVQDNPAITVGPVAGATVEFRQINAGLATLRLLDRVTTDADGRYNFPASTGLGMDVMLVALDSQGTEVARALAVDGATDIDAATELVIQAATSGGGAAGVSGIDLPLTNFSASEYAGCVAQARAVIPAGEALTLAELVQLLDQTTGGNLIQQVLAFSEAPERASILNGPYWILGNGIFFERDFEPGVVDISPDRNIRRTSLYGTRDELVFDGVGGAALTSATGTDLVMTEISGTQRFSQGSDVKVNASVLIERFDENDPGGESGSYDLAGDGGMVLQFDDEPLSITASVVSDGSFLVATEAETFSYDSGRGLFLGFPKSSAASASLFSGQYHYIGSCGFLAREPSGQNLSRLFGFATETGSATANGSGGASITFERGVDILLAEDGGDPNGAPVDPFVWASEQAFNDPEVDTLTYTVGADGALAMSTGNGVAFQGAVNPDGSLAVVQDFYLDQVEGAYAWGVMMEKGSGINPALVAGDYILSGLEAAVGAFTEPGTFNQSPDRNIRSTIASAISGRLKLEANGTFTIPALVFNLTELSENSGLFFSDFAPNGEPIDAIVDIFSEVEADQNLTGTWTVSGDGTLTINVNGITFRGAVAADGTFAVFEGGAMEDQEAFRLLFVATREG